MVPFKPYFVGDETAPFTRAASVQKCVRAGGKHNDLEEVGRTTRPPHLLRDARQLQLRRLLQGRRHPLGVGVLHRRARARRRAAVGHGLHHDDEAEAIWRDEVGRAPGAHPRMGDDNFWAMADTGPCGPCSEIFCDRGPESATPAVPPRTTSATSRSGTSCSCSTTAKPDGELVPLPAPNIDTGAGLERILAVLQGVSHLVGHRRLPPADRGGRAGHRRHLRRRPRRRGRRLAAHPRRPRPHDDLPRHRRRGAVERGAAAMCCGASSAVRCAACVPAGCRRPRHPRAGRRDRRARWATAYPDIVKQRDLWPAWSARGGAASVRRCAPGSRCSTSLPHRRRRAPAATRPSLHDTLRLPDRPHAEIARGAGPQGRRRRLPREHGRAAQPGQGGAQGRGRQGRGRAAGSTASCSRSSAPPTSPGATEYETTGAKVRGDASAGGERARERG